MGEKLIIFVVFAITVGGIGPVLGHLVEKGSKSDYPKVDKDRLFAPLNDLVESIYGSLVIAKPNEFTKLVKYQCGTYSSTETIFEGVMAGIELIDEKNCSRISEIKGIEEATLSAARQMARNIFSGIRSTDTKHANSGNKIDASEEEAVSEWTEALRSLFLGMEIILSEMCPGNSLVNVENSIDSLNAAEEEANTRINAAVRTMFNPITKIYSSVIVPLLGNLGGQVDSIAIDSERDKAYGVSTKLVNEVFNRLRISLLDIMEENNEKYKENCLVK